MWLLSCCLNGRTHYRPLMKMASGAVVSGMTSGEPANKLYMTPPMLWPTMVF